MTDIRGFTGLDYLAEAAGRDNTTCNQARESAHSATKIPASGRVYDQRNDLILIDFDDVCCNSAHYGESDRDREQPTARRDGSGLTQVNPERQRAPSPTMPDYRHKDELPGERKPTERCRTPNRGNSHDFPGHSVGAKLGTFNGSTCFETFLAKFNNCAEYFGWQPRDQLFHLKACLEGSAGQVLWDLPKETSVGQLVELLRNRFGTQNQAERYRAELRKRRRKHNESLQELYQDIRRLMSLAYAGPTSVLSEVVARDAFLEALDDHQLRVRILEREPTTLDEALHIACRYEALEQGENITRTDDSHRRRDKYVRSASKTDHDVDSNQTRDSSLQQQLRELHQSLADCRLQMTETRREIESLRNANLSRGEPHMSEQPMYRMVPNDGQFPRETQSAPNYYERPPPDNMGNNRTWRNNSRRVAADTCRKCRQPGHWARECPKMRGQGTPRSETSMPNVQTISTDDHGTNVYLDVVIYGRRVLALLDTGCETSVIGENLVPKLTLNETDHRLYAANGTSIPLSGEATVIFRVDNIELSTKIVVSTAIDEMILGIDFLTANKCRWDFGHSYVELGGHWIRLQGRPKQGRIRRIYAETNITVPARHQMNVPVKLVWSDLQLSSGNHVVESRIFQSSILSARTLVDANTFHSTIPVMNLTDHDYSIPLGTYFGDTEYVDEIAGSKRKEEQCLDIESPDENVKVGSTTCSSPSRPEGFVPSSRTFQEPQQSAGFVPAGDLRVNDENLRHGTGQVSGVNHEKATENMPVGHSSSKVGHIRL
jgi:predicted aspartyl protease